MQPPFAFTLPFLNKEMVAKDIYSFSFSTRKLSDFTFLPGQFVRMILDLPQEDPRSNRRYFTISSSPHETEKITITTKITDKPSIFKQKLLSLTPGELVRFWGPSGSFIIPEGYEGSLVFLSGGMGITPFHSIFSSLSAKNEEREVTLISSFVTSEEVLFFDRLQSFSSVGSHLKIVYTLTAEEKLNSWIGERGRITYEMLTKYVSDLQGSLYFVSGPIPFVKAMIGILQSHGVGYEKIKEDNFPGY